MDLSSEMTTSLLEEIKVPHNFIIYEIFYQIGIKQKMPPNLQLV